MAIGDPYITDSELKDVLGITDTSEDVLVARANRGAARAIENRAGGRTFWKTATAVARTVSTHRRVVPVRGKYLKLLVPDIASTTEFVVSGFSTATVFEPERDDHPIEEIRFPWGSDFGINDEVTITAFWGWPEVPDDIYMANQMQATRYYNRRGSPEGVAGSSEWGMVSIPRLDPDVRAIVEGYRRPGLG